LCEDEYYVGQICQVFFCGLSCGFSVLLLHGGLVNAAESDPVPPFLRGARGDRDAADRYQPQFDPASLLTGLELGLISQNPSSPTNQSPLEPPLDIDQIDADIPKNRVESINLSPISVTPTTPTTPTTPATSESVNEVLQQIEEYNPIHQSLQRVDCPPGLPAKV
jgi:hypothetical protein